MKKNLLKHLLKPSSSFTYLSLCLILFMFSSQINSQTVSVQGRISASRFPVKNAMVTFIDETDTTNKISALTDASGNYQISILTSAESNQLPTKFELEQSYPNPFSSSAAIPYQLKKESNVQVTIYDILGREVRKFNVGLQSIGVHNVLWDGHNNFGQRVTSGVYFYRLQAGSESQVKKMIFNESVKGLVPLPRMYSAVAPKVSIGKRQGIEAGYYTIRVENSNNTAPLVVSQQLDKVLLQKDTTINFTVDYTSVADIDLDSLHQVIRGFGAASPWYLSVPTDSEIESAFGTETGRVGLSIFRITVESDSNLWGKWVPSTKKANEMGAKIIASPWNAPARLTETVGNITRVRHDKYAEYAAHLNSFIAYMEKNGVPIYGLSVQNEPEYGDQWTGWTPDEMLTFMRDYANSITGTRVMAPESFQFRRNMSDPILNDSAASANTDIICGHIYGGGLSKYPLAEEKGKEVWMTEYLMGENNSGNNLQWAIALAQNINAVMLADMNTYVWWTMVRYYGMIGDGTIASNPQDPRERYPAKGEVTKKGYVMSQFARFIRPGYYRVESGVYPPLLGTAGGVSVSAYEDPVSSKTVIIVINTSSSSKEQAFRIHNGSMSTTFTPYTTSESKNCEKGEDISITDGNLTLTVEPSSITTFISN